MYTDNTKKILAVEDDAEFRKRLYDIFAHEFTFITAEDGEMAIEKLLVYRPDLVLLDMLLPKLDGFEVLKRIREYPDEGIKATPVIILSNLSGNEDVIKASNLKIDAYFVKSHTEMSQVEQRVREVLKLGKTELQKGEIMDFRDMGL